MKTKFKEVLSFLIFLTFVSSTSAFAQIFGADDETLNKIFIGLKKINSRLVNLETEELGSLKSQFENVKIEEVEESAMIEVIDGPIVPFKVTRPKKASSVIFTFIFTFLSLFFFLYLKDYPRTGSKKHTSERKEAKQKLFKNIKSLIPFIQK